MSDDTGSDRDDGATDDGDGPADAGDGATDDGDRGPFDSFDEYRDREGDPFDSLGADAATGEAGDTAADDGPAANATDRDPFEYGDGRDRDDSEGGRGDSDSATGADRDGDSAVDPSHADASDWSRGEAGDPLADVEVSDGDPFESNASAFERSDVEGIDPDEVWARLTDDGDPGTNSESGAGAGESADGGPSAGGDDVAEVSKHAYCEGCEHFSPPPDVACGHEGTEILEFVDIDTVRVADCPIVAERRELEDDA